MANIKLKPCPFCGAEPIVVDDNANKNRPQHLIRCKNISCTIRPKTDWYADKSEVVKHWNTR